MDRRAFLSSAVTVSLAAGFAGTAAAAERYFPTKVDHTLFEEINRVKDPANKTALERGHAPVLSAAQTAKAGEPFAVTVSVGETLHPMGMAHWIEYIELSIGNEPAGRVDLQPKGYLQPKVTFNVMIPKEAAPDGKATLVAREHCNLHGLWEGSLDIAVSG